MRRQKRLTRNKELKSAPIVFVFIIFRMSKIGRFCIQHDWLEALEDGESFWISFYGRKDAEPSSIHGKVNRSLFSQEFESVKKENRELVIELDEETEATFIYSDKVFQASDGLFKAKFLDVSPREVR